MGYAEDQTDKAVEELEKELTRHYKRAYKAIEKTSAEYMVKFEERDKELRELLKNDKEAYRKKYCVGASLYMTPEEHYKQWRLAQIGRGKRWEAVKDEIARAMVNANKEAAKIINKMTPGVYELNSNYAAYVIEKGTGTAFNLLDQSTVDELTQGNHTDFRTVSVNPTRDYNWNSKRIQDALTSGILQGQSIPHLTQAFMVVMGSNRKAAIRNARTAMTSAQNAGALSRYKEAQALGIEMQKEWISTHDARVRDSHARLDGVRVGLDEKFPNGLICPGDPQGRPEEVYNCRCTIRSILPKRNDARRTNNTVESYQEWAKRKAYEQSYSGGIGSPVTNLQYINSDEYKNKFKNITSNQKLNNAIYKYCKAAVIHQSGDYYEDLTLLGKNGKLLGQSSGKIRNETYYTKEMKKVVETSNAYEVISIHNHGTNLPPSGADFGSAGRKRYAFGIIACHDGSVYKYSTQKAKKFTSHLYDMTVEKYVKLGYNKREAMITTLNNLKRDYGIEWSEL